MEYSHVFGSNFPQEVISIGTKKDIDDSVKDLILQYYSYIDSGNVSSANELFNSNKTILEQYIVSSSDFNRWNEEIYNLGVALLSSVATIISDTEPDSSNLSENSHWLQEY